MKTVTRSAFQGDILIRRVGEIPASYKRQTREGRLIIGHSETGHHHAIDDTKVAHFADPKDPLVCYLQFENGCDGVDVTHHRAWDTHETIRLLGNPGDVWQVRRQREHTPEGWRRVAD